MCTKYWPTACVVRLTGPPAMTIVVAWDAKQQNKQTLVNCMFLGCMIVVKIRQVFERRLANIFLTISFNTCFEYSKESSHRDDSFEY